MFLFQTVTYLNGLHDTRPTSPAPGMLLLHRDSSSFSEASKGFAFHSGCFLSHLVKFNYVFFLVGSPITESSNACSFLCEKYSLSQQAVWVDLNSAFPLHFWEIPKQWYNVSLGATVLFPSKI